MGIAPVHSNFECLDGHWAFHRSIQISSAQMGIGHSTWAFRFLILRWAMGIQPVHLDFERVDGNWALPGHSEFECLDGHWAVQRGIHISNAQMDICISSGIPAELSDLDCSDGHWAFHLGIQISNAQMGNGNLTCTFRFRMSRWALGFQPMH